MMRTGRLVAYLIFLTALAQAQPYHKVALLNSILDEQNPVLSPDRQVLYFTVDNNEKNIGGKQDYGDVWYSQLTPDGWGPAIHGGSKINNKLHNTVAGFSTDGKQMYLMGHYADKGASVTSQGLSVSTLVNGEWSKPMNIVIPYYKNLRPYETGCLSNNGKVLVFSAEPYVTVGLEDIYVSFLGDDGKWSEPLTLGRTINTEMDDVTPSLSADSKRLYFASNGRKGLGSFDVFYSDRLDDTWQRWSEPVSLGNTINSEGREMFYRITPVGSFYSSTKNSDGYSDILFEHSAPELLNAEPAKPDTLVQIKELVYEQKEETKSIRLWGNVSDAKTQVPVVAKLHLVNASHEVVELNANAAGSFEKNLPGLGEYTMRVEAPGYIGLIEKLDLSTQVLKDLEMNFKLQPVEVGATVNLKSVLFQQSTPTLLTDSYDELDMVADFMNTNPRVEIELAGHTDNRGYHNLNMKLSRERVEAVKKYLVSKGIEGKRITGRGYGGTKPIADNDADETRALNRRVEFTILKN